MSLTVAVELRRCDDTRDLVVEEPVMLSDHVLEDTEDDLGVRHGAIKDTDPREIAGS